MERVKIMLEENLGGNCHIHPRERDEGNFLKSHNLLCVAGAMMEERCAGMGALRIDHVSPPEVNLEGGVGLGE